MDRHGEHIAPFVENALRAVAMVDVDVEDRDTLVAEPQMGGCDRAVVEKAKTAGDIAKGVVTGRAAERVDGILAIQHHCAAVAATSVAAQAAAKVPGPIGQPVRRVPAEPADDVGRVGRGMAHRMHVGDHLGPASPSADQASQASARKPRYSAL